MADSAPAPRRIRNALTGIWLGFVIAGIATIAILGLGRVLGWNSSGSGDGVTAPSLSRTDDADPDDTPGDPPRTPDRFTVVGDLEIPSGPPGEISVVLLGPVSGDGAFVVMHNRTETPVNWLTVYGTARSPSGELLDMGASSMYASTPIGPDEWSYASVDFWEQKLPADTVYEFEVIVDESFGSTFADETMEIVEATFGDGTQRTVSGIVRNPLEPPVAEFHVTGLCFSNGLPIGWSNSSKIETRVEPGGEAPFEYTIERTYCDAIVLDAKAWMVVLPDGELVPPSSYQYRIENSQASG